MTRLCIVVPCYDEEDALPETQRQLTALLHRLIDTGKIEPSSKILYIDDGSRDATWSTIEHLSAESPQSSGIKLSRNVGHQHALLAGLMTAPGDVLVSIDADLQDDPRVIEDMIDAYHAGSQVVYGIRKRRETDTRFKRMTARGFYRMMRFLGAEIQEDHADFRLMSRRTIEALRDFREVNLFLRGIVPLIGYPSTAVYYDRTPRVAGESKYPLRKMLGLALDGITSLSSVPLRMITFVGLAVFLIAFALGLWTLGTALFTDRAVPGWASTVLPIYFIGGIQIFCLGVIGEYTGKIYLEVKARPRYLIERSLGLDTPGKP